MKEKTHYRKVFKSDHLGVADLEEYIEEKRPLIFTIKEVRQEINVSVAGRRGNHNIAYFYENIKPLVLNSTNSKVVKSFNNNSPFVEDWRDTKIQLYIDSNVKMKGEIVGGVRINPVQPKAKVKPAFTEVNFEKAKKANATIEQIKKAYTITKEIETKYLEYGAKK
jgi:hypothetical protein